jgi:NADH-quinone oxidoreductase subunit M
MLNGFVGEFLILLGTFHVHWNWSAWAATGVILSACYLLWSYQRVFFGEVTVEKNRKLPDASAREKWILAVMAVITIWMGVNSPYFTRRFAAPSQNVLDQMQRSFPQEAQTQPLPRSTERLDVTAADRRERLASTASQISSMSTTKPSSRETSPAKAGARP